MQLLDLAGLGLIFFVTYFLFMLWSERSRFQQAHDQHGCKIATRIPSWDRIFGLDLFVSINLADIRGLGSEAYNVLHKKYGSTFEMKILGGVRIQTSQPENIQAVCTSAFEDWGVGPMRGTIGAPFLGRGIFTDDGSYWKHSRALIRPTFSRTEIADLGNFERHVKCLMATLPKDGSSFDILPLLKQLFLDTSTEFLFGKSTDSLLPEGKASTDDFMQAFDRSLLGLALLLILGPIRWPMYLDPFWRAAYKKVHAFIDTRVDEALNRKREVSNTGKSDSGKYIVLDGMTFFTEDRYELRMQILNVFFPARDTAAIAFGNALFELARHPSEYRKLRDEIQALGDQPLTFETIKSLMQVRAIVNETLRLHPASSRIGRCALKDTVLPKGGGADGQSPLFVPKGRVLEMDLYSLQRDPSIWGASGDADEFRPARWIGDRPLWESKWQYEPFLGGIRMCPAQNQVVTQLAYLLVRFAQEFEKIESRDPVLEYYERATMTIESKNGVKIALLPKEK